MLLNVIPYRRVGWEPPGTVTEASSALVGSPTTFCVPKYLGRLSRSASTEAQQPMHSALARRPVAVLEYRGIAWLQGLPYRTALDRYGRAGKRRGDDEGQAVQAHADARHPDDWHGGSSAENR